MRARVLYPPPSLLSHSFLLTNCPMVAFGPEVFWAIFFVSLVLTFLGRGGNFFPLSYFLVLVRLKPIIFLGLKSGSHLC